MANLGEMAKLAVMLNFPDAQATFGDPPESIVRISPADPDFGMLEVVYADDELTAYCGRFTHVHFSNYDSGISPEEHDKRVITQLVGFLSDVFADRIEFWGSRQGRGGCFMSGSRAEAERTATRPPTFVWSGPVGRTHAG